MKFIISSHSPKIWPKNQDFDLKVHHITEEEFYAMSYDAYSCIGHKDIAELTNCAYNKEAVKLRIGDILFLVTVKYHKLNYHCIRVMESEHEITRNEELDDMEEYLWQ